MPNGFEAFAQNAIALGGEWRQRRKERKLSEAMSGLQTDPQGAIQKVMRVDPVFGYKLGESMAEQARQADEAKRTRAKESLTTVIGLMRPVARDPNATPESIGQAYDSLMPILADGLGMGIEEIAKWRQMITTNPAILDSLEKEASPMNIAAGGAVYDPNLHREVYRNPTADKVMSIGSDASGRSVVTVPSTYGGRPAPGYGGGEPSGAGPAAAPAANGARAATPDEAWNFILPHEGGYAAKDGNGHPVNFGINQGANPDIDVKRLTPQGAKQLFTERYWNKSGAGDLPASLGVIHADTYYISPKRAEEFLAQSGGDPAKYMDLREAWMARRAQRPDLKRFKEAWENRNADLREYSAQASGASGPASAAGVIQPQGGPGVRTVFSLPPVAGGGKGKGSLIPPDEAERLGLDPRVRWQYDQHGVVKMVGPATQLAKIQKMDQVYKSVSTNIDSMEQAAQRLLSHPGLERAVGVNSYVPSLRGGKAADFEADLEALKSKIGFAVLQDMRQTSPTGGAVGNVSDFENKILQRNIAALELSQSPAQFRKNLRTLLDYTKSLKAKLNRAYEIDKSRLPNAGGGPRDSYAAIPRAAQDTLRQNPSPQRRQQFDQVFGQGAAARVLGGKQ